MRSQCLLKGTYFRLQMQNYIERGDGSQNSLFHSFETLQALVTPGALSVF